MISGAAGMTGVFLDTAWHRTVGRDSFFVLPHLFIYGGGLGIWTASVAGVTAATLGRAGDFGGAVCALGRLRIPAGFGIALLGVLIVGAAAPVDVWWHWLYGKDAVNGAPVDLTPYPLVRLRLRGGESCAWVGVVSLAQRASENHFVYTIQRAAPTGPVTTRVEMLVVFKDP